MMADAEAEKEPKFYLVSFLLKQKNLLLKVDNQSTLIVKLKLESGPSQEVVNNNNSSRKEVLDYVLRRTQH